MAFSTHDIVPDSPTNNFATLNPLQSSSTSNVTSEGNLRVSITSLASIRGNFYVFTRKWYCEVYVNTLENLYLGLASNGGSPTSYANTEAFGVNNAGNIFQNNAYASLKSIALTGSSTYGIYFDADAKLFWISKNGQWYSCNATTVSSISKTDVENGLYGYDFSGLLGDSYTLHFGNSTNAGADISVNTGQDPTFGGAKSPSTTYTDANGIGAFYYQPPAGALALSTANLPDFTPTVTGDVPQDYFKTVLYTGNNGTNNITDLEFQPDFIWIKAKTDTRTHNLVDSVRGFNGSSAYVLQSDGTGGEFQSAYINSLDANGFTVSGSENYINNSSHTYVAWCWKAGGAPSGSTSTTGSAKRINTSGTQDDTSCSALATAATNAGASNVITPTLMSINQAAGFSILQFSRTRASGQTVPHGLTSAPEVMILKEATTASTPWVVYHKNLSSAAYYLLLHDHIKEGTTNAYFNSTHPNSSVFTLGDASTLDTNVICYLWHSVENYSKCGSYVGNGAPDGPFVYCGFRPAFVMIKRTDADGFSWGMYDNKRPGYNEINEYLLANQTLGTQSNNNMLDFLSNGIKITTSNDGTNATNGTYIYMAFAEQPFKYSNAR